MANGECCGGKNKGRNEGANNTEASDAASGCCGGSSGTGGSCGCKSAPQRLLIPTGTAKEIATLPAGELVARFRRGVANYDPRVFSLTREQMEQAFLPDAGVGRWSVRMLLGHMADAEIAAAHRLRRAVAEDQPLLSVWDENAFIDSGLYELPRQMHDNDPASLIGGFVAVVHTMRMFNAQWLGGLEASQWERVAMHPERGPMSVRTMVALNTWHLEHHARYLQMKLDRMLGAVPEPVAAGAGTT